MPDPNAGIAKGFDDLAKAFVPNPQTMLYGAKAGEAQAKTRALTSAITVFNDPNSTPEQRDNAAAVANLYAPTQGEGARNMHDATQRYDVDQRLVGTKYSADSSAGAARYGHDRAFAASTYNTDANAREKHYATDVGANTDIAKAYMSPVKEGETRFLPPDVAAMYKAPATQYGGVTLKPGDKTVMSGDGGAPGGGPTLQGNPKPQTLDEAKGGQFAGMTDDERNAIVFGNTPIEKVPDGSGKNVPKTRPQTLAGGVAPVDNAHEVKPFNYLAPDGKKGLGVIENGVPVDATTKQPLPQGVVAQALSGVQSKDALGSTTANVTEANRRSANLDAMQSLVNSYSSLLQKNPGVVGPVGDIRAFGQNLKSTLAEMTSAFGDQAPQARVSAEQVMQLVNNIAPSRDPAIQQQRVMAADLAYKWAQAQNPSGEVSRQAFERALDTLTGGLLRNNTSTLESLSGVNDFIQRERGATEALRHPQTGGSVAPAQGGPAVIPTAKGNVTFERVQ